MCKNIENNLIAVNKSTIERVIKTTIPGE